MNVRIIIWPRKPDMRRRTELLNLGEGVDKGVSIRACVHHAMIKSGINIDIGDVSFFGVTEGADGVHVYSDNGRRLDARALDMPVREWADSDTLYVFDKGRHHEALAYFCDIALAKGEPPASPPPPAPSMPAVAAPTSPQVPMTMTRTGFYVCWEAVHLAMDAALAERDALLIEKAASWPLDVQRAFAERDASRAELVKVRASGDKLLAAYEKVLNVRDAWQKAYDAERMKRSDAGRAK